MKKNISILLFLLSFSTLFAVENDVIKPSFIVKGVVKNRNNEPVSYASIAVIGTNIGIAANVDGKFQLKLNKGKYKISVSCTGYKPQTLEVDTNNESVLDIVLEEDKGNLSEVVVTSTQSEKMLKDIPVVTRVITAEQIKRIDPQDFKSLLEYELPGLQFGRAHGSNLPAMSFQGMRGRYVLFLVDGERIAGEAANDNIDFNRLGIDNIERIEIVRGAMSTLYGSNALSGVVNIITKKANRPFVGNVSARLTSYLDQKYALSFGTRQRKFSALTSASYSYRAPYEMSDLEEATNRYILPDGRDTIEKVKRKIKVRGYRNFMLEQKLGYDFTERFNIEIKGGIYQNTILDMLESGESVIKKVDLFRSFNIGGKARYILNENNILDLSYNHDTYNKYFYYPLVKESERTYGNSINNIKLNYRLLLLSRHAITAGMEFYDESLKHYMFKDSATHNIHGYVVFLQDDYMITDQISIVGGLRMDYHSRYRAHLSPKISAMYKLRNFIFRGGYAAGFRSPSLKELYQEWDHNGMFVIIGNKDLKPEISNQLSLSGEMTVGAFNASLNGYYNWFKDMIMQTSIARPGRMPDITYKNADGISEIFGVDVNLQVRLPLNIMLRGAYSYVNDKSEIDGRNFSMLRPHTLVCGASYNRKIGKYVINAGLNGRWMSGISLWSDITINNQSALVTTNYAPQMIWKLNAGCSLPRGINLNLGIDNLFNTRSKNVSNDAYALLTRGIEFVANVSINIAELIGK